MAIDLYSATQPRLQVNLGCCYRWTKWFFKKIWHIFYLTTCDTQFFLFADLYGEHLKLLTLEAPQSWNSSTKLINSKLFSCYFYLWAIPYQFNDFGPKNSPIVKKNWFYWLTPFLETMNSVRWIEMGYLLHKKRKTQIPAHSIKKALKFSSSVI
jgi:hypothetical protein